MSVTDAWEKITGRESRMGAAGLIPVYDGKATNWLLFRNTEAIQPGRSDPAKVDRLRQKAQNLLAHYPETIPQLEKLGVRVKMLLNRPIKTPDDVDVWAASIFNTGPMTRAAFSQESDGASAITTRPRGRPRKDGLVPGSKEAKAADEKKRKEREKARRVQERAQGSPRRRRAATITELPAPSEETPRRLVRVGSGVGS